jgi:hypothetical protein
MDHDHVDDLRTSFAGVTRLGITGRNGERRQN